MKIIEFKIAVLTLLAFAAGCGGASVTGGDPSGAAEGSKEISTEETGGGGGASNVASSGKAKASMCSAIDESDRPWIVDKALSEKVMKSSAGKRELVFAKYSDCGIELLTGCGVGGGYLFRPTRRTKLEEIVYHLKEMYEQLPFDARRLEAEFKKGGVWSLQAAVVGEHETSVDSVGRDQLSSKCAQATHFLKSFSVGAYRLEVMKDGGAKGNRALIQKGGSFERCLLSATDASSPACQNVVRVVLRPIQLKSPLPPSDKHHLVDQPLSSDRGRRVEPNRMGEMVEVPEAGKTSAVLFWGAACELCPEDEEAEEEEQTCEPCEEDPILDSSKRMMGVLEKIWQKTNHRRVQVVGVAADMDGFEVRQRLPDLNVTFPMIADGETGKLKSRFLVNAFPALFIIDSKGYVRFYSDCSPDDEQKISKAISALSGK